MSSSHLLTEKLALVTGGGSGIGRATCQVLAREGSRVVVTDINYSSAKETVTMLDDPSKHLALLLDVTKSESVDAAISLIIEKYKAPPTLLVNCAGISCPFPVKFVEENKFTATIDVNLKGTFLTCKAVANAIVNHGDSSSGSIVNVASITGVMGLANNSCYAASKGGVIAFTKSISKELIKDNIRVNSVLPGPINTPMVPVEAEHVKLAIQQRCPIGRFGQPKEVAEVIAFLLSDRSSFMVGSNVEVTGGFIC